MEKIVLVKVCLWACGLSALATICFSKSILLCSSDSLGLAVVLAAGSAAYAYLLSSEPDHPTIVVVVAAVSLSTMTTLPSAFIGHLAGMIAAVQLWVYDMPRCPVLVDQDFLERARAAMELLEGNDPLGIRTEP